MRDTLDTAFAPLNRAYNKVFQSNRLSIGLVAPLETYAHSAVPDMTRHIERAQLADTLGFSAFGCAMCRSTCRPSAMPGRSTIRSSIWRPLRWRRATLHWVSPALSCRCAIPRMWPRLRPRPMCCRVGTDYLRRYLMELRQLGINHVALNLRFNGADIETTMKRLADEILPGFAS